MMAKISALLISGFLLLIPVSGIAQVNSEFQIANRLFQQQRYEEALPFFQRINRQEPEMFLFFDRLIDCHIQLKQYDIAIELANENIEKRINAPQVNIVLGELYYLKEDTTRAFQIWERNLEIYSTQLQLYLNTANAMIDRRAYLKAIDVYRKGRQVFNNDQLFVADIPNAYMQAGKYEEAIAEWLILVKKNPQQSSGIQRMLMRYNDPLLYDIAVLELEDQLAELSSDHASYRPFYELQIWLLLENQLFRRAFATAKEYEERTSNYNYSLFNVGKTLTENNEFEMALQAFDYYSESSFGEIKWRANEEKANTYTLWAKYLDDYSLDFFNQKDSLFNTAMAILDGITEETRNYSRIKQVYLKQAEIALDFVFDKELATIAIDRLKNLQGSEDSPESNYLDGRLYLADKEFTSARISFTRSNKQTEVGDLAEKTRYFLALTDFYAGDFEFAQIQLKSLGRQNTSFYANDALELRLWLQKGIKADTTGEALQEFATAHFNLNTGKRQEATNQLLAIVQDDVPGVFVDDAYLMLSDLPEMKTDSYIASLSTYVQESPYLSQREEFLWEIAKLADELYSSLEEADKELDTEEKVFTNIEESINITLEKVIEAYEVIILEYPQGFYAPYARKRLSELPKPNS